MNELIPYVISQNSVLLGFLKIMENKIYKCTSQNIDHLLKINIKNLIADEFKDRHLYIFLKIHVFIRCILDLTLPQRQCFASMDP
jgi:hypothetical protein